MKREKQRAEGKKGTISENYFLFCPKICKGSLLYPLIQTKYA